MTPASSVFDLADHPISRPPAPPQPLNPAKVVIKSGVPIPPLQSCRGYESPYVKVLMRMKGGDMVEVTERHGASLLNAARRLKIVVARRKLGDNLCGVWRVSLADGQLKPTKRE